MQNEHGARLQSRFCDACLSQAGSVDVHAARHRSERWRANGHVVQITLPSQYFTPAGWARTQGQVEELTSQVG